jgi:ATP-dependent Zn protease
MTGWSGAQIANFVNISALNAVKKNRKMIIEEDLDYSYDRYGIS